MFLQFREHRNPKYSMLGCVFWTLRESCLDPESVCAYKKSSKGHSFIYIFWGVQVEAHAILLRIQILHDPILHYDNS